MFRGYFYPAGREKLDALGALDLGACGTSKGRPWVFPFTTCWADFRGTTWSVMPRHSPPMAA